MGELPLMDFVRKNATAKCLPGVLLLQNFDN